MLKLIIALWIIFFIYIGYLIFSYFRYKLLIKKLLKIPFPDEYKKYLSNLYHYQKLPNDLKIKIERSILLFIKTKQFIGVKIDITDEIKMIISFYACLIVLNRNECYENLEYIYVYPHTMILNQVQNNGGIYNKEIFLISGEFVGDSVVIAWDEAKKDIYHYKNRNVIIHEFTHELDFESGNVDGIPLLETSKYNEWINIIGSSYEEFKYRIVNHKSLQKYKLLDKYASTNAAEFFAVLSETFWSNPKLLKKHFPKIYKEFKEFFKFDTFEHFTV